jgi:DNA-binding transcriptional regulator GbsR (MarR family)
MARVCAHVQQLPILNPAADIDNYLSIAQPQTASEYERTSAVERATEFSEDVIRALEDSGRAAIEAVRGFLTTVEKALPQVEGARKMEKQITDSALEMAEQLVHTQAANSWSTRRLSSCTRSSAVRGKPRGSAKNET